MDDVRLLMSLISQGRIEQDRRDGLLRLQALAKAGGRALSLHHLMVEQAIYDDDQMQELVRLGTTLEPSLFSPRLARPAPKGPTTDVISLLPKGFDAGSDTVSKDPDLARALATAQHHSTRRQTTPVGAPVALPFACAKGPIPALPEPLPPGRWRLLPALAGLLAIALASGGLVVVISSYRARADLTAHRDQIAQRLAREREARRAQALALYQEVLDQGNSARTRRALEAAVASYDRVLEADPDFEPARYYRGRALFRLERYREAALDLERAVELDMQPDAARIYAALALLRSRTELESSAWGRELKLASDDLERHTWTILDGLPPASRYQALAGLIRAATRGPLDQHARRELDAVVLGWSDFAEARFLRAVCTAGLDPLKPLGSQLLACYAPRQLTPVLLNEARADLEAFGEAQPFHQGARLLRQALGAEPIPLEGEIEPPAEIYLLATWSRLRSGPAEPAAGPLLTPWALARSLLDAGLRSRGSLLGLALLLEQGHLDVAAALAEQVSETEGPDGSLALARALLARSAAYRRLAVWPPQADVPAAVCGLTTESLTTASRGTPSATWDLFALDLGARAQAQAYQAELPPPPALVDAGPAEDLALFLDALEGTTPGALDPPPLRRWRLELHRLRARAWDDAQPPPRGRYERAVQLYARGRLPEARRMLEDARGHTRGGRAGHALAVVLTSLGEHGAALEQLEQALAAGYRPARPLLPDPDFAPLRDRERFIKLAGSAAERR